MSETPQGTVEARLRELGLTLPPPLVMPAKTRTAAVQVGPMLYLSGHGGQTLDDGTVVKGKVGKEVTQEQGYAIARSIGLKMIATIRATLGDLDRVQRIVKIFGMVNADPLFEHCNLVINGASDVFCEVFGPDVGQHARSSLVVAGLVGNQPVEIEGIVHVRE
jgi:enamine deaminase RidA (YjgF/YER057c/UK114 family)